MNNTDKIAVMDTYGNLKTSFGEIGTVLSIVGTRKVEVCSIFLGENRDNNIDMLYKELHHKVFLTCCYIELHDE